MCLSISEKPGSATHPSTSTTSTGLLCLLVGAHVHFIFGRSHELMRVAGATTQTLVTLIIYIPLCDDEL